MRSCYGKKAEPTSTCDKMASAISTIPIICQLCLLRLPSISTYLSHLRQVHSEDKNLSLNCVVSTCSEGFRTISALNSHVYRNHRQSLGLTQEPREVLEQHDDHVGEFPGFHLGSLPDHPDELQYEVRHILRRQETYQQREAAKFLLNLKEVRRVSEQTISDVIEGSKVLFGSSFCAVKASLKDSLVRAGIDESAVQGLTSVFDNCPNPFDGLETSYMREKYYKTQFDVLVSGCSNQFACVRASV